MRGIIKLSIYKDFDALNNRLVTNERRIRVPRDLSMLHFISLVPHRNGVLQGSLAVTAHPFSLTHSLTLCARYH